MGTDFNTNKPYHPDLKTPEQIFVPTPQMRIRTKVTAKGTQKILCEIISKTPVKATSHKPLPLKMIRLLGTPFIGILRILFPATEERLRVQVAHLHEALIKNKEPEDVQSFIMGAFKKGHRLKGGSDHAWLCFDVQLN